MSQRVVGYEGRRPQVVNEGGSSPAVSDPMASLGRLSVAGLRGDVPDAPTGGAGPVERRLATPEELAAARAREAEPSHLVAPNLARASAVPRVDAADERTRTSRQRGGEATRARVAASRAGELAFDAAGTPQAPEEPAVAEAAPNIAETIPGQLGDMNDKLLPVLVIGCPSCVHREVCSIRPKVDDPAIWALPRFAYELHPAIHASVEVILECDHFLPEDDVPKAKPTRPKPPVDRALMERAAAHSPVDRLLRDVPAEERMAALPAPPRARRGFGALTARQRQVLDAVIEAGDRKAAAGALKTTVATIDATLRDIGEKGFLTPEVMPLLSAGIRAKYAGSPR